MTILEKVAYLRGLSEGLGIDETSKEGRVFKAITDLEDDVAELSDGLDEIDEDLGALEEEFYGDECDDECGCGCGCEEDECDDEELYEVTCPACGDSIYVNEEMLDEGFIHCPNCHEKLEFDFECDGCDDCSCEDCSQDHE